MARKEMLRKQREGTVINETSKRQESDVMSALRKAMLNLASEFNGRVSFEHQSQWPLREIVRDLRTSFEDTVFHYHFETSSLRPDGGILFIKSKSDPTRSFPVLIAEVKNQGTNDVRALEGKSKQARGNAIERLGKNVIGLRTALLKENIFPFVCFGYGCDFEPSSSILDRVTTIAMFGELNKINLHSEANGKITRGSFFFRREKWSEDEMYEVMHDIAKRSVLYYFSKYGEATFTSSHTDHEIG